jgi:carbonic anhydrase
VLEDVIRGVAAFQRDIVPAHRDLFDQLAHGQSPDVLFIGCSDSRVDPSLLTQAPPGRLFVLRNAGNLVPPSRGEGGGEAATIEYAVRHLGVSHIVVCGHSGCGAMTALVAEDGMPTGPIGRWLRHASSVAHSTSGLPAAERLAAAVEHNVVLQLSHLGTHPAVRQAVSSGKLQLHGWVYDIATGGVGCHVEGLGFVPLAEAHAEDELIAAIEQPGAPQLGEHPWLDHGPFAAELVSVGPDEQAVGVALQRITGCDSAQSAALCARAPVVLMKGITAMEAQVIVAWLSDHSATVRILGPKPA